MDVSQLLYANHTDQSNHSALKKRPLLNRSTTVPQPAETKVAFRVPSQANRRSSLLEASNNLKPVAKTVAKVYKKRFSVMEVGDLPTVRMSSLEANQGDPWSEAYQRHRQNFLRLKGLFDSKEVKAKGEEGRGDLVVRANSVEEGFYSDVST